ncbi:protein BatD [Candidatus Babeliales bacterium]|nr:protein BatD [Candidatus Babeliales bacterium]
MKRLLFFFLLFFTYLNCAEVRLELSNTEINIDDTFQVKAIISSSNQSAEDLKLLGINKFDIVGRSSSKKVTLINGNISSETTYLYKLQADKEGEYEIGPATVKIDGKQVASNNLKIKVSSSNKSSSKNVRSRQNLNNSVFFKLIADKDKVVVGESLTLIAKFYYKGNIANLYLAPPEIPGFMVKEVANINRGAEVLNGTPFNVIEKSFVLTPIKVGMKTIEPFKAQYKELLSTRRGFFDDMFTDFFRPQFRECKIDSNALTINVEDLPKLNERVDAVGNIKNFAINVDSKEAQVNEPIKLTVEIEGTGNLEQIATPKLNLSDSFKCYDSNVVADIDNGKKFFEYVLQVNEPGKWEIPGQKLTYFNTTSREIQTLTSKPIDLDIKGEKVVAFNELKTTGTGSVEISNPKLKNDIRSIEEDGRLFTERDNRLNFWVFLFLILLPAVVFASRSLGMTYSFLRQKISSLIWPHEALFAAKNRLKTLQTGGEVKKLYSFWLAFFADKFSVSESIVSEDWIRDLLLNRDWPFEKIEEFLDYFHRIAGFSFSTVEKEKVDKGSLFVETLKWVNLINKKEFKKEK